MQMPTEPTFIVTQSQLQALMAAVQSHLNNSGAARAALSVMPSVDKQLADAWQAFDRSLVPHVPATPPDAVPGQTPG